jgi:UDP-N-acetylglucosamine 2-epimerase (non-hydrolysing)
VDDPATLGRLIDTLSKIGAEIPVIFPVHPRTRGRLEASGLVNRLTPPRIHTISPLGYLGMLGLLADAKLVMTDSGGIQEETTALGVPCLTLRSNTERPITVEQGTSTLVGNEPESILTAFDDLRRTGGKRGRVPELWDGQAAERIVRIMAENFCVPARPAR